jgi:hypothetical protein
MHLPGGAGRITSALQGCLAATKLSASLKLWISKCYFEAILGLGALSAD